MTAREGLSRRLLDLRNLGEAIFPRFKETITFPRRGDSTRLHASPKASDGSRRLILASFAIIAATGALLWLGSFAIREWRGGARLALERRESEILALVSAALERDMRGAAASLLAPLDPVFLDQDPPYDLRQVTARMFAQFPYPESVIVWKARAQGASTYVFNRAERAPAWDLLGPPQDPYPVVIRRDPEALADLIGDLKRSSERHPFTYLTAQIAGVPYHVVARRVVSEAPTHDLRAIVAFTVNIPWVRAEYFGPLLSQILRISGSEHSIGLRVADLDISAAAGPDIPAISVKRRVFPLLFVDPEVLYRSSATVLTPDALAVYLWPTSDNDIVATEAANQRVSILMAIAAAMGTLALIATVRAVRTELSLTAMKSDFIATVTHDLKTPVALIRLVGDTLANGRYASNEAVTDYAKLLSAESARLSRSIDNLLTYSRYTESGGPALHARATLAISDVLDEAVTPFTVALAKHNIALAVDVPPDLPHLHGDHDALVQVFEGIIDNAIKYRDEQAKIAISCWSGNSGVYCAVADNGIGIAEEDLPHLSERFFRGRNAKSRGSGLGLAIAQRIVAHHRGTIRVASTLKAGTTVEVWLPALSA